MERTGLLWQTLPKLACIIGAKHLSAGRCSVGRVITKDFLVLWGLEFRPPAPIEKLKAWQPAFGRQRQGIPGASSRARLAEPVNCRVSERACLKGDSEEQSRETLDINPWFPHAHPHILPPTHIQTHMHSTHTYMLHTHTCLKTKQNKCLYWGSLGTSLPTQQLHKPKEPTVEP